MEDTLLSRLNSFIVKNKINKTNLANLLSVNRQTFYNYINGDTPMPVDVLEQMLITYPKLDVSWLFKGEIFAPNIQERQENYSINTKKECPECKTKDRVINDILDEKDKLRKSLFKCNKQLQSYENQSEEKRKVG